MMTLAHVESKSRLGRRLAKAFPECFSARNFRGPVPLSALKERALKNGRHFGYDAPEVLLAQTEALRDFDIPCAQFSATHENQKQYGFPLLPENLLEKCDFGSVVSFHGKQYVVVENAADEICLSPAHCIDTTK